MADANLQAADQAQPGLLAASGLAPGFARDPSGQLRRNGQPPDSYGPDPATGQNVPMWKESAYQAPTDLKQPLAAPQDRRGPDQQGLARQRGPSGPTGLGKEIADATFSGLIKPDLAQKAGVPPEGMALLNWVMKGESHGFNELYRGTHFSDFSDHPANLGWRGDTGPDGRPTSAAGGPQFEKATWNEAKNTLGLTDFSDVSQTKAAWWLAQRDYGKRTGRDLSEDLKAGHLDQLVDGLKGTWTSLGKGSESDQTMYGNQSWGRGKADEFRRQGESDAQRIERNRAEYLAAAEKAPEGSAERAQMLHEAHEASRRATEQYDKLLKSPPIYQPTDAFAGFGGVLMALAAFAGGRAAQPLTGSLTAMSGMLDGMNQGNKEAYDRAYHIWDMQTEGALKLVNLQNTEIRNILEDQRTADNEKAAHLQTIFAANQMHESAAALREGNWMKVWQIHESSEKLAQETGKEAEHVREFNATYEQRERFAADRTPEEKKFIQQGMDAYQQEHPDATPTEINNEQVRLHKEWAQSSKTKPASSVALDKFLEENPDATSKQISDFLQNQKGTRSGQAAAVRKFIEENPGATSDDIMNFNAKQARVVSTERAFGSGFEAKAVNSMNTVADHLELLREAANALGNKDIQRVNTLQNRIRTELGDTRPTTFAVAREIAADEIARAVIGGVGSETTRESMRALITSSQSPEQLEKNIREAERFIGGRLNSYRRQYSQGDPDREKFFDDTMLSRQAKTALTSAIGGEAATGHYSAPGAPTPGTVEDGFVFQGGDPKDPKNWKSQ